jgi:ferredoxin
MAEYKDRFEQNIPGRWYVDTECIDCDLCRETAPETFRREDEIGFSVVFRQPQTPEELERAEEARSGCPAEAIGNDGATIPLPDELPAAKGAAQVTPG